MADDDGGKQRDFSTAEWELVKDLVFTCQTEPPPDPAAWLAAQNAPAHVRREVERLLAASAHCGTFLDGTASEKHLGLRLHRPLRIGRYRVMDELGSGGSGVVYAAWDESLDRKVAVKVLRPEVAQDPELQKRLRWDARAASALQHPNIVVVHEVGSDAGMDYVAMECIAGQTLKRHIPPRGLEPKKALALAIQICRGLEAAHSAGIVHRDLKPGNIMITGLGVVKILDFGLAKNSDGGLNSKDAPQTVEGRFAGTVAYVSPEQADAKAVDARSDIFSFGSVFFEMLTGQQAFPGDSSISILADILLSEPRQLGELRARLEPGFEEIVSRCLRKDRERRFQSIAEVRVRLQELEDRILHPESQPSVPPPPKPRWLRPVLAALALTIVALAAVTVYLGMKPTPPGGRPYTLTRLTADRGLTAYPAISKDASLLAYASDRGGAGNLDLWVQHINGNEPKKLTTDPADDYEPVFSPDGTRIVFRSERNGGGLYTISTLGGEERLLVAGGHGAQFSPDGQSIAYWTGNPGVSLYPGSAKIFVIPALGGVPQEFQPGFQACAYPTWSPDGERILFLGHRSSSTPVDWWIAPVHGGGAARATGLAKYWPDAHLTQVAAGDWPTPTAWLADQTLILPARNADSDNIWAFKVTSNCIAAGEFWRLTGGTALEWHPAITVAKDRSYLAYEARNSDTDIWQVPLDEHGHATGEPQPFLSGFASMGSSSLSRDGARMVFSFRQAYWIGNQPIRMLELPSRRQSIVANVVTNHVARPVISGDGKTVAYWANKTGYMIGSDGGAPQKICGHCGPPTHLSFDGQLALFESPRDPEQILLASLDGPPQPLIALDPPRFTIQSGARFSPDGRSLVFSAGNSNSAAKQIFIAPLHPGKLVTPAELIPVTEGEFPDIEPYWATDGRTIFFLSDRDGFRCIWARSVDDVGRPAGPVYAIAHFHHASRILGGENPYSGEIGLSAGPKFLVFTVRQSTSDIWLRTASASAR